MRFGTLSGTIYDIEDGKVRRAPNGEDPGMREDGEWVELMVATPYISIGYPAILALAPLGEGGMTIRTTTEVTWIGDTP